MTPGVWNVILWRLEPRPKVVQSQPSSFRPMVPLSVPVAKPQPSDSTLTPFGWCSLRGQTQPTKDAGAGRVRWGSGSRPLGWLQPRQEERLLFNDFLCRQIRSEGGESARWSLQSQVQIRHREGGASSAENPSTEPPTQCSGLENAARTES